MSVSDDNALGASTDSFPDTISLMHGEGGRGMRSFIRDFIVRRLGQDDVQVESDAANIGSLDGEVAITTDSFVVSPLFFPGGDIGSLAVHGTVNDLSVGGAVPLYLTLALIIEEGFASATLDRVLSSVAKSARHCGVRVVCGDTKVVPRGAVDGLFLNTTGVGVMRDPRMPGFSALREDVNLIVSGPIGNHGIAVLCERESLGFTPPPQSDSAPLHVVTSELQQVLQTDLVTMRDATRGGVAAVLHEWAESSGKTMWIDESTLPVDSSVRGISETLGLDPLFIANEGTFVAAVNKHRTDEALAVLHRHEISSGACVIGMVRDRKISPVLVHRGVGVDQPLDEPIAAMLPRIC